MEKVPRSRRYRLLRNGNSICLVFLKLFERICAPLTAGLLSPLSGDTRLQQEKRSQLDRLYQRVIDVSTNSWTQSVSKQPEANP